MLQTSGNAISYKTEHRMQLPVNGCNKIFRQAAVFSLPASEGAKRQCLWQFWLRLAMFLLCRHSVTYLGLIMSKFQPDISLAVRLHFVLVGFLCSSWCEQCNISV